MMTDLITLNATDLILLRRLCAAVTQANTYSTADLNDAKVLASVVADRFDFAEPVSVTTIAQVAA